MTTPDASVIVRVKNAENTLQRSLELIRQQRAPLEIIVVDSGSTDRSRMIADASADLVLDLAAERFTFGGALNLGAARAKAPVHFAVSSHCFLPHRDWVSRSLDHYADSRVAGTAGGRWLPNGEPVTCALLRGRRHTIDHPFWGFSNHASSWRGDVWREFPFDEHLTASEDQEWAWRVVQSGWFIAVDPELTVPAAHRWEQGALSYYRRQRREVANTRTFMPMRYGVSDLVTEWWRGVPRDSRRPAWMHRVLDYRRLAGLAGKFAGAHARPLSPADPENRPSHLR